MIMGTLVIAQAVGFLAAVGVYCLEGGMATAMAAYVVAGSSTLLLVSLGLFLIKSLRRKHSSGSYGLNVR